jgi:His-Xaa-Ser system radical SAM maturase HxsB
MQSFKNSVLRDDTLAGVDDVRLRQRALECGVLFTNDAGQFLLADLDQSSRISVGRADRHDLGRLSRAGLLPETELARLASRFAAARRQFTPGPLDYLILVPTLRCNLACTYCQVSRASPSAAGFDWNEETLKAICEIVAGLHSGPVKIEFQGGEPTLRSDLIRTVIEAIPKGVEPTIVICSNLQAIDDDALALFDRPDVSISTSLDGPLELHARQRQGDHEQASGFLANLDFLIRRYGPSKISALPTIDPRSPPEPGDLIEAYALRGFRSIYLRPINYQGFARKRHAHSRETDEAWLAYHERFIRHLIERNFVEREQVLEETYFSILLRRIFRPGADRHVDLRNPNPMGRDYIVIDYDGLIYPTDEARMLARSGVIDLSIGDVHEGWDSPERAALDAASTLNGCAACERCAYKPYCGRDIVDDIARYGTIDVSREATEFCRRHMYLFDLAFELIHSDDEAVRYSLGRWLGLSGDLAPLELAS